VGVRGKPYVVCRAI